MTKLHFPARLAAAVLFLTASAGAVSAADDAVFGSPVSADNSSQLRSVLSDIAGAEVMKGRFVQVKTLRKIGRSFESRGTFLFSGENGIVWNVETPFPSTLVLGKDSMIQKNPDGTASVIDASDNPVFLNFASAILAVFSGDFQALQDHYEVFFTGSRGSGRIGLLPRDADVAAIIGSLVLVAGDSLQSLLMEETTGDTVEYRFTVDEKRDEPTDEELRLFSR